MAQNQKKLSNIGFSKKGISPLVATIILIIFSVGLGAIVMSWGETYIEQSADFAKGISEIGASCDDLVLNIIQVKGNNQICYLDSELQLFLEGDINTDIPAIQANIIGTNGVDINTNILANPLKKTEALKTSFNYNSLGVGEILQVKLTPLLGASNARHVCAKQAIVLEDIKKC